MSEPVVFEVTATDERKPLKITVKEYNYGIQILVDGYGCMAGDPGRDGIICLERSFRGHLLAYIWDDIKVDEPLEIYLENANEEFRQEEEDAGNA